MARPAKVPDLRMETMRWLRRELKRARHDGEAAEVHAITKELQRRRAAAVLAGLPEAQLRTILETAKQLGFIDRLPRRS